MGKKNLRGAYNDFLDGEKLRDNAQVRTSLTGPASSGDHHHASQAQPHPPPPPPHHVETGKRRAPGNQANRKPRLTHFLCLPLVNADSRAQLERNLAAFKQELEAEGVVPLAAIRPVGTLHLTLGVMALDEGLLAGAGRCLQELDLRRVLEDCTPALLAGAREEVLSVDLKALVPMHARQKTSILYAEPVDSSARLYPFASALRAHFAERGFLVEDARPLKLHATILNTVYAKPKGRAAQNRARGHGPGARSSIQVDASRLVERYEEFFWAQGVRVGRVQICRMGARKVVGEAGEVVGEEYEEVFGKEIFG